MAKGGGDKISVAEVKAATGMTSGVGKMSQAERAEAIASAKVSSGAGQSNAPAASGALSQVASPAAYTGQYMDRPDVGALSNFGTDMIGQFSTRSGKDRFVGADGNVYKVTPKGTVKEVNRFEFGSPIAPTEEGGVPGWSDYNIERASGQVAKYPTSTFKLYGEPEETVKPPVVKPPVLPPVDTVVGGGGSDVSFPGAPGTQYGVTDQLPWYSGPNNGRRALNLGAPGSGDYSLPSGNKIFGINWQSDPFSGKNWGDTMMATTGMSDADLYSGFIQAAQGGNFSLSSLAREMGLPPGAVHEMYSRIVQWAAQNNQPIPSFPEFSQQTAPYYTYGFGPSTQQVGYEFSHQGDNPATKDVVETDWKSWDVNPLGNWMDKLQAPPPTTTPPPATTPPPVTPPQYTGYAKGGSVQGGLGGIQQDPAIKRYMKYGGNAGGQDDVIDAKLAPNEYVFDADTVAALGDGNPDAGAMKLDKMRENIRRHKRSAPATKIPPKAKAPEQYMRKGK